MATGIRTQGGIKKEDSCCNFGLLFCKPEFHAIFYYECVQSELHGMLSCLGPGYVQGQVAICLSPQSEGIEKREKRTTGNKRATTGSKLDKDKL